MDLTNKFLYLSRNIKALGQIVGIDNLVPKAITMTSKKYQFTCPICGEQYFCLERIGK